MAAEVRRDERADDAVLEPALTEVVERTLDEHVAEPLALVLRVDLGVDEHDRSVLARVADLPGEVVPEPELVPQLLGVVDYARLHEGTLAPRSNETTSCGLDERGRWVGQSIRPPAHYADSASSGSAPISSSPWTDSYASGIGVAWW